MGLTVVVNQKYNAQDVCNVYRYEGADAILSFAPEITDLIAQLYINTVADRLSDQWNMYSCTLYETGAAPGAPGLEQFPTQGTIDGTNASTGLSNQTALISSYVCNGGPPFRGRAYHAGLANDQLISGGVWGAQTIQEFDTFFNEMLTLNGSGLADIYQVVESTKSNTVPAGTRAAITGVVIRSIPGTQRRRRIGVGS